MGQKADDNMKKKLEYMTRPELERILDQVERKIISLDDLSPDIQGNESEILDDSNPPTIPEHLAKLLTYRKAIEEELKKRVTKSG